MADELELRTGYESGDDADDERPLVVRRRPGPKPRKGCTVKGCERPHCGRGLCQAHLTRLRRGQRVDTPIRKPRKGCKVPGCKRRHYGKGLCGLHHTRLKRGIPLDAPVRSIQQPTGTGCRMRRVGGCRIGDCGREIKARGLCKTHYERARRHPEDWSGPVDRPHGLQPWGEVSLRPEVHAMLEAEAAALNVTRNHVLRTWLDEVYQRKAEEERQRTKEDALFGRYRRGT